MKNGAFIENGICVNVAVFADDVRLEAFGAITLPNGFGIGDRFDGTNWSKAVPPEPTPEEANENRKAEIISRLAGIDIAEIRPLAALACGTATDYDSDKLTALETEKSALRAELALC